jgi:hypothetical protein
MLLLRCVPSASLHESAGYASPGGTGIRDDAVLRRYKYVDATAMTRCPGSSAPPAPAGYFWNDADVLSNFRGAAPESYCPDPYAVCR